jgi:beta-lactamase superfamily II metal-dependent hydrolase
VKPRRLDARPAGAPAALLAALVALPLAAGEKDGRLDIYWTDVEGGAATLIVTPAGESVLIDAGMPGDRDPARVHKTVTEVAKLERLDHMVVTHFDIDHFGGVADVAARLPIARFYDPGFNEEHLKRFATQRQAYEAASKGKRTVLRAGDRIALKRPGEGSPPLSLRCLAAGQAFVEPDADAPANDERCATFEPKAKDMTENANSIVLVLEFGAFRLLDAADLTWNLENQLVCPRNLVGKVDVYQSDHHGLDSSNNPVLVRSVQPRVAIINNGPRKGCEPGMFKTLKSTASIEAIYQLHRNVRVGPDGNTSADMIANREERCDAAIVVLSVARDGRSYEVAVPSTGHSKTYATWK